MSANRSASNQPRGPSEDQITLTLDAQVLQFLKQVGQSDPSRYINDLVRERMNQQPLPLGAKPPGDATGHLLDETVTRDIPGAG